jgi:glycosyltransferase involved in cell wall biosynthesis
MLGSGRPSLLLDPGTPARTSQEAKVASSGPSPLVSCIMASRGKPWPALHAIHCYRRQSHEPRELIIATIETDGILSEHIADLNDPTISLVEVPSAATIGALRNAAVARSRGELVCVWDDDDLSHPDRIAAQLRLIRNAEAQACFLTRVLLWWPHRRKLAVSVPRIWENTMLLQRAAFPLYDENLAEGEDTALVKRLRASHRLLLHDVPEAYCYIAHGGNMSSADHFEMLFAGASQTFVASDYDDAIAKLSATLPMDAYAAGLTSV